MTKSPDTEELLRIESASEQLLDALTELHKETVSVAGAHSTLQDTGRRVSSLADGVKSASGEMAQTARALRDIGTPQILEGQRQLASAIDGLAHVLDTQAKTLQDLKNAFALESKVLASTKRLVVAVLVVIVAGLGIGILRLLKVL